jgi:hypothetical protein
MHRSGMGQFNSKGKIMITASRVMLPALAALAGLGTLQSANALTITGTTGASYLVSGSPFASAGPGMLRVSFENNTSGTNLELCAGTDAQFGSSTCGTRLSDSGGPGFQFLTVIDVAKLDGKNLYVLRAAGTEPSKFTIVIE